MSDLDELYYQIPPDVLSYEPRYIFGLTVADLLAAVLPAVLIGSFTKNLILAGAYTLVAISLLKRFDSLGNRSFPVYYIQRWQYNHARRSVVLPLVLPPETQTLTFESWEGEKLFEIESEGGA